MPAERPPLPDLPDDLAQLWFLMRRVSARMDRAGEALFRKHLGISLARFLVLSVIEAFPRQVNQQMIADRLGLTKSTVSRQIEGGVAAGLIAVVPSARSRRENDISLTEDGIDLVRRGDDLFEGLRGGLPTVPADAMATTLATLAALDQAFDTSIQA